LLKFKKIQTNAQYYNIKFYAVKAVPYVQWEHIQAPPNDHVTGPVWPRGLGRGIALLFHDRGTRTVSGKQHTPATLYPQKDPVPILQEAGWPPGPVWTGGKSRPHLDLIPDCPARSQSLY